MSTMINKTISIVFATIVFLCFFTLRTMADSDEIAILREELQSMKADYESRIAELESKIEALQKSSVKDTAESTAPADRHAEVEALQRKNRIATSKKISDIHYKLPDLLPEYVTRGLEFHGYLRSGYGINGKGGKMEAFQAPGALAKYRLGNETDTYVEAALVQENWNPEPEGATFKTQLRVSYKTFENENYDLNNEIALREAYAEMGNFAPFDAGLKVWAGERFYRMPELEINDFWWYDMSGYGGGFEDLDLGFAKFNLAYIGVSENNPVIISDNGRFAKNNIDARLHDFDVPGGKGTFWVNGGYIKGGTTTNDVEYPNEDGFGLGFMHYVPGKERNNQLSLQYGYGANRSLQAGGDLPPSDEDKEAWTFRATDMFNAQVTTDFSVQIVGLYQYGDNGADEDSKETWLSLGMRPIYHFTRHLGIVFETGLDRVDSEPLDVNDYLWKNTIALRLTPDPDFDSRPSFRLYCTYADWGDEFEGKVGGDAYANDTDGLNVGVQCETWW